MPINRLLYDHQLAILRAQHAALGEGDLDLRDRTDLFAMRIAAWRNTESLPTIGWPGHAETRKPDDTPAAQGTRVARETP